MGNILFGIAFIIGGLSGELVLVGTESSGALTLVGAGMLVWGIVQLKRGK